MINARVKFIRSLFTPRYCSLFVLLLVTAVLGGGCSVVKERDPPREMDAKLSEFGKTMLKNAFTFDAPASPNQTLVITDYQVHIAARGTHTHDGEAYLHPDLYTWRHPFKRLKTLFLLDATQVLDYQKADEQYRQRLLDLMLHFSEVRKMYAPHSGPELAVHFYLYALDYHYDEDGNPSKEYTDLYVSNDYVIRIAREFNRQYADDGVRIIPVASLHPYREDFEQTVESLAEQGIRFMKWLPPSMNIDFDKVPKEHYLALARHQVTLFTHTGKEYTLQTQDEHQVWGNPYQVKPALECGVNVVALHSGRTGKDQDSGVTYFRKFINMMENPEYRGRLFGEISLLTQGGGRFWPSSHPKLNEVIVGAQPGGFLQGRMINGSDYPVPAITLLNINEALFESSMISATEREQLDIIFAHNPLLYDFVVKRTLRNPDTDARLQLPDEIFLERPFYQQASPSSYENC